MPTHKQRYKKGNKAQNENVTNVVSSNNVRNAEPQDTIEETCTDNNNNKKKNNNANKTSSCSAKISKTSKQSFLACTPCALLALDSVCKKLGNVNVSWKTKNATIQNNASIDKKQDKGIRDKSHSDNVCTRNSNRNSDVCETDVINNSKSIITSISWTLHFCRSFTSSPYPHGMLNSSNFCFINSIMQVLIYIPSFAQLVCSVAAFPSLFAEEPTRYDWWINNLSKTCPTINVLARWFAQYWKAGVSRNALAAPKLPFTLGAKNARCVDGSAQQDAHEFLQKILETINDELFQFERLLREHDYGKEYEISKVGEGGESNTLRSCRRSSKASNFTEEKESKEAALNTRNHRSNNVSINKGKSDNNNNEDELKGWTFVGGKQKLSIREATVDDNRSVLLEQLFNGRLETHLNGTRKSQNYSSVLVERFYSFAVDIGFAAECTLEEAIERTCMTEHIYDNERDKNLRKTVRFRTLPDILVLHLRRWTVTREGELVKLDNYVKFGRTLVIPHNVCGSNYTSKNSRSFHLLSAVAHRGASLTQGHYVTYLTKHVANPALATHVHNMSECCADDSINPAHVVLCNDTKITLNNISEMYNEPVYFLIYQKAN